MVQKIVWIVLASSLIGGCNWFRSELRPEPNQRMLTPGSRLVEYFPRIPGKFSQNAQGNGVAGLINLRSAQALTTP